jgi:hypothetical protein
MLSSDEALENKVIVYSTKRISKNIIVKLT